MEQLLESGVRITPNEPLSKHTTLGIGGPAEWYAEAGSVLHLKSLLQFAKSKKASVFLLGAGSNLLVSDLGIAGLVIRMRGEFENFNFSGASVRAGAGVFLPTLVKACAERGLSGAEALVGVPGTVGGGLIMNCGTPELWLGTLTESVEALNDSGALETIAAGKINFKYRSSSLGGKIICFATLKLAPGLKGHIQKKIQEYLSKRLQTQPIGTLNVGSIFKNPEGHYAAQLIEKAGLKGHKMGAAQISLKHANFFVNAGGATANDFKSLVDLAQKTVKEKFGIDLEPEIKMVGRPS